MRFALRAPMFAALLAVGVANAGSIRVDDETEFKPTGKGFGEADHDVQAQVRNRAARAAATNGIIYHGGPLILGTTNVYYIWYGNWAGDSATTILSDLGNAIGGSPYFNINTTYTDGGGNRVANSVRLAATTTDNYTFGTALSDAQIQSVVSNAITSGRLPKDTNALYFVLTSKDVTATSGFCTQYCGWHDYATIAGSNIKFSFVGNAVTQCPSGCAVSNPSPNGNPGADAMASVIAHELEETVTDPNLNAWYDRRGYENADKCAYTYGATYTTANGAVANMKLGQRDFKIQQNWVNASGGRCAKAYP